MATTTAVKKTIEKKRWVEIIAPKIYNNAFIGETYVNSPDDALGRIVTVSMSQIGGEGSKQFINLSFRIIGKNEDVLTTKLVAYKFSPAAMKRFSRKQKSKMEDSFVVTLKDSTKVRIKPLVVARAKAQGGVMAALKKETREFFILELSKMTIDRFWQELSEHNLQKKLFDGLRKTYPLSACEVRWALVEGEGVSVPEEELEEEASKEEETREEAPQAEEESIDEEPAEEAEAA